MVSNCTSSKEIKSYMSINRIFRSLLIATATASTCVVLPIGGAWIVLGAGGLSLWIVADHKESFSTNPSEFFYWLLCVGLFVAATLVLPPFISPFPELPVTWMVFIFLSPIFGTMAYAIEVAFATLLSD